MNEKTSLKQGNVYCMDIICNIQAMNERINANYDRIKDYKRLEKMSFDKLFEEQAVCKAYQDLLFSRLFKMKLSQRLFKMKLSQNKIKIN